MPVPSFLPPGAPSTQRPIPPPSFVEHCPCPPVVRSPKRDGEAEVWGGVQGKAGLSLGSSPTAIPSVHPIRGQGVCELRSNSHSTVAAGQDRPLPVQCLRPLSQDEWAEQAPYPAQEAPGKTPGLSLLPQELLFSTCAGIPVLLLYKHPYSPYPSLPHPALHRNAYLQPTLVGYMQEPCPLPAQQVFFPLASRGDSP